MANLVRWMSLVGAAALVAIMLLTTIDVFLRAAFGLPIFGAQEITELALVLVATLGIAYCGWTGGHIVIDLASAVLPDAALRISEALIRLLGAAVAGVIAWRSVVEGLEALHRSANTNLLGIPQSPFYMVVGLGLALYALVLVIQSGRVLRRGVDEGGSL